MVECGLGISVVHDLILHPNRHGIIKKPLDEPYYRDIAIATSAAAQPSTITRMFCEHALEWARDTSSVIAPATAEAPGVCGAGKVKRWEKGTVLCGGERSLLL